MINNQDVKDKQKQDPKDKEKMGNSPLAQGMLKVKGMGFQVKKEEMPTGNTENIESKPPQAVNPNTYNKLKSLGFKTNSMRPAAQKSVSAPTSQTKSETDKAEDENKVESSLKI